MNNTSLHHETESFESMSHCLQFKTNLKCLQVYINYKLLARAVSSKEAVSVMLATFSGNVQSSLMSIQVHY